MCGKKWGTRHRPSSAKPRLLYVGSGGKVYTVIKLSSMFFSFIQYSFSVNYFSIVAIV